MLITDGASNRPCRCIGPGATLCHTASNYACTDETIGKHPLCAGDRTLCCAALVIASDGVLLFVLLAT